MVAPVLSDRLVGYARVNTDDQDLTLQIDSLLGLGVSQDEIRVLLCVRTRAGPNTSHDNTGNENDISHRKPLFCPELSTTLEPSCATTPATTQ
jgi:hypothetical protein